MNPRFGWALAAVALVVGATSYGWRGFAFAASVTVFWLLLQLNRSIRVMRTAAQGPLGRVPSAVMLHARLKVGMPMLQVVTLTRTLGKHLGGMPENWAWADASGAEVRIAFDQGRTASWVLVRPEAEAEAGGVASLSSLDAPSIQGVP